jgi:hypothetical protein
LGGRKHRRQIPFQLDLQAAVVVSGFNRTSHGSPSANKVRVQGALGRREDDGVDKAADRFTGFGARVRMFERLREVGHLLPVQLRHSWMQEPWWLVGRIEFRLQHGLPLLQGFLPFYAARVFPQSHFDGPRPSSCQAAIEHVKWCST